MSSCSNTTSDATCDVCTEKGSGSVIAITASTPAISGTVVNAPVITTPGKSTIDTEEVNTFYELSKNKKADDYDTGVEIGIVTEEVITGKGQFDKYMRAGRHQLDTQYTLGRIKGADYTAAYIAMQEGMMAQANQFILGKYQADALLAKMEAEIGEMKAKGILERNLLTVQIWKTELEGHLTVEKIETEQLNQQMIATQEEELRKNGAVEREATKQTIQKVKQEIILIATQEVEMRRDGSVKRAQIEQERQKSKGEALLIATQEVETRRTGATDRSLKNAQADHAAAQKHLVDNQSGELLLNGTSKRKLEAAQALVAGQQVELYKAQAAGFVDRNRNDTLKTTMNAWAISVAEQDNITIPANLENGVVSGYVGSAAAAASL